MSSSSPRIFAACVWLLLPAAAFAQDLMVKPGGAEKAPSVIPAPRAEPVVPASPAKSIATQLNDAFVNVFEHVAPAVVVIDVQKRLTAENLDDADAFSRFVPAPGNGGAGGSNGSSSSGSGANDNNKGEGIDGDDGPGRPPLSSEGSGFIIQAGGFILTNDHVVANASKIAVHLHDGRQFAGRVVGTDEKTDIAVVKIDAADLPVAELADSEAVRVGEIALAVGVPFNLKYSFTMGIVSAKGRNNLPKGAPDNYDDYIQTDASINPGNSGGPLVNLDGKVIGMTTLIYGMNRGLGFAIPSNMLRETGDQLIHAGRVVRPFIGVRIVALQDDSAERYRETFGEIKKGLVVLTIMQDTPAFNSDLQAADVITEVDGVAVTTDRELQKQILGKRVGATVQLTVWRNGRTLKIPLATAELAPETTLNGAADEAASVRAAEVGKQESKDLYGMQLQGLTKEFAASLGLKATVGVVVTAVARHSPAADAKISVRDVITAVDTKPIKDVASFKEAAKAADPRRGLVVHLERPTGKTFVVLQ